MRHLLLAAALSLGSLSQAQIAFTANTSLLPGTYGNPSCVVDMNGDHLDDVVRFSGTQMFVAFQQPDGTFAQQSFGNSTVSPNWSICAGDLSGNGFSDVMIGNGSANSFMWANATGTGFTETYFPPYIFSQRTNMVDINNDGLLDAFCCHDVGLSKPYRNTGLNTVVEDHSLIQQVTTVGGNYSSIFTDIDNDGDLDLYITKCRSGAPVGDPQRINLLYRNNGDGTWTEIGAASGMNDGAQSWTTVFEDFNNDGYFDALIVNHTDGNRLMMNNGDGTFTNAIAGSGIPAGALGAWEGQGADFDNDGFIDIFTEIGAGIYRNNGDGTFTPITFSPKEGGIGDLNNDGWMDIHLGGTVYLNNGGSNHWIKIALEGIFSNMQGIGARLWIFGDWGVQTREIRSGTGFSHMSSLTAHFGLGQSTSIDSLVIDWPSGVHTVVHGPAIDQLHVIPEVACTLPPIQITASGGTQLCPGGTVELSGPDGYETYQWNTGGTTQSIQAGMPGNYTLTAFDGNGCAALSNSITVFLVMDAAPEIDLLGEALFCEGDEVVLISSNANNAVWSDGTVGGTLVATTGGSYTVTAQGICGPVTSAPVVLEMIPAPTAPITEDVAIPAPATVVLEAEGENILWYLQQGDLEPAGEGPQWETPFLNITTTFWCEANSIVGGQLMDGGKPDNSGGGGIPSTGSHSFFDATEPFIIETVRVYAVGAGSRVVNLCDAAGVVLATTSVDLSDGEQVIELGFEVPAGLNLSLRCPQHNLFRNSSGVNYPYAIGTMGQLTGSGFGPTYYYYFYDWKVRTPEVRCPGERVPVTVQVGTVGLAEGTASDGLLVYPVPAHSELRVDGLRSGEWVVLNDATGRQVMQRQAGVDHTLVLAVETLASGTYLLEVRGEDRHLVREVVITR